MTHPPRRSPTRRVAGLAVVLALVASSPPPATGTAAGGELTAHALAPVARQTVAVALGRLAPRLARDRGEADAATAWTEALASARDAAAVEPVKAAYQGLTRGVFSANGDLSPAGEVAVTSIAEGRYHGHAASAAAHARVQALRTVEHKAADKHPALEVDAETLLSAWEESAGSEDRLAALTTWLGQNVDAFRAVAAQRAQAITTSATRRAQLEIAVADGLVALAAAIEARPRTEPVLEDKRGHYLSPDSQFHDAPPAEPTEQSAKAAVTAAAEGPDALATWLDKKLPVPDQYRALVGAVKRYQAICDAGGWQPVAVPKPKDKHGPNWEDTDAIKALQTRLAVEGFFEGEPTGVFGDATGSALKRYQIARNLKENGLFDKWTAISLRVPCERRLALLELNVERWRHSGRTHDETYVEVNLAGFEVRYVEDGELVRREKTIVGSGRWYWDTELKKRRYRNATPILQDVIYKLILNPSWTVPPRIILNEFKPKIAEDPDWLEKEGYVVKFSASGRRSIVQPPGPDNVLGDVKFVFPNAESIYLHDTNRRGMFGYARRSFSHGCVRVDNAFDLARTVLYADAAHAGERRPIGLKSIAKGDKTWVFRLKREIPIYLEYYTASVTDEGVVRFHPDIYDYDTVTLDGPLGRKKRRLRW